MTPTRCRTVRANLGAFLDGELPGVQRLVVSQHLAVCDECRSQADAVGNLGELLRLGASHVSSLAELGGLAGGVISRVRAEQAQSWTALLEKGVEDWHWVIVGVGSVAATFVSGLLVSFLVLFGSARDRDDSLAALLNNLGTPAGTLFVLAAPTGNDSDTMVMQFDNDGEGGRAAGVMPAQFVSPTESDLVQALDSSLVNRDGRVADFRRMSATERLYTDSLVDQISRLRLSPPRTAAGRLTVQRIGLVAMTSVTAKAL